VRRSSEQTAIVLRCAVEASIFDIYGRLDLPEEIGRYDYCAGVARELREPELATAG